MTSTAPSPPPADAMRPLAPIAAVVVLGAVMSILDTTIVNVAIGTLGQSLHASLPVVQWVATAYLLALATVIPLTGWAADRFGARRVFLFATALFMAGSALAGAAWSVESLIAFRVLQGLGGGMIMPAGITLVGQAAGPARMGRVMGWIGVPMVLGPILGPVLGGWLVEEVSWRWLFLVNLPVGVVVLLHGPRLLPAGAGRRGERLDWRGLALLSPGLGAFVYGLAEVGSEGGAVAFSARSLVPLGLGLVLVGAFAWHAWRLGGRTDDGHEGSGPGGGGGTNDGHERSRSGGGGGTNDGHERSRAGRDGVSVTRRAARVGAARSAVRPLLDVRLLRVPSIAASAVTLVMLGAAFLGTLFLLALYFQVARDESPLATGLLLIPQGVGAAVTMPLAGRLTDRLGAGRVVLAGLVPFAGALLALTQVGGDTSYWRLGAVLFAFGLGMGATMMPAMTAAYRTLTRADVARATAMLTIVQRVGSSAGTALVAVLLAAALPAGVAGAAGEADVAGDAGLAGAASAAAAFADAFWLPCALVVCAFVPAAFLSRRSVERS